MIRNILEILIMLIVTTILNFNKKVAIIEEKLDLFYKVIEGSSYIYNIDDEVYLIFDYQYVEEIALTTFEGFEVYINKESESYFSVIVVIKEKFLNKEIKEDFYLKRGDIYD